MFDARRMSPAILVRSAQENSQLIEVKTVPKRARTLASKTIYHGRVVDVKVDRVVEPGGVETTREVVCHPGSVVVIPRLPDERLVLVRQYRYAAKQSLWELVAGGLERGETPSQGARRELLEEASYRARSMKRLLEFYPSPGILSEKMYLFEARGLTPAPGQPDADERIEPGCFTLDEIRKMITARTIRDGKTLVGVLWLLANSSI
jgi:ADP-ribose pyrophosphatase